MSEKTRCNVTLDYTDESSTVFSLMELGPLIFLSDEGQICVSADLRVAGPISFIRILKILI